jgi:hypothetical protein
MKGGEKLFADKLLVVFYILASEFWLLNSKSGRLKTNIGGEKFIVQKEKIQSTQLNLKNLHSDSTST